MANMANMINAAFRANKQQLCSASTSQPGASSDPTVTIPGPSHHMAANPYMVPSATNADDECLSTGIPNYENFAKASYYFRVRNEFHESAAKNFHLIELKVGAKELVRKNCLLESWVNDVRKAAIELDDIGDEMFTEMLRLQALGHKFDSEETRSVRKKMLLKIKILSEDQEDLIKRAIFYGLGTNSGGDMLQCGTCKSLQPHHSIKAVPTYACY